MRAGSWEEVITHPSVIRAVIDYVLLALQGRGRVTIADGPQTDSDFEALVANSGLGELVASYATQSVPVRLLDLRRERWFARGEVTVRKEQLPGDPAGYVHVDLGSQSSFEDYRLSGAFYGADYDMDETRRFHSGGRHEYIVCRTPMESDVFINIPKLKTHKKTGVTISLKNLVGINGYRNCLPHHTLGSPEERGDEFPDGGLKRRVESGSISAFKQLLSRTGGTGGAVARGVKALGRLVFGSTNEVIRSGNWSGNDTAWRMVLDLNRVLLWFNEEGRARREPRRYLSIVDGVVGGEGNGPLAPQPVESGLLLAGTNPWAVDWAATKEMGLDPHQVPFLIEPLRADNKYEWLRRAGMPLPEVAASGQRADTWHPFEPHFGWTSLRPQRDTEPAAPGLVGGH